MVTEEPCHNYVYFYGFICIISFPFNMLEIMYSTLMCVILYGIYCLPYIL